MLRKSKKAFSSFSGALKFAVMQYEQAAICEMDFVELLAALLRSTIPSASAGLPVLVSKQSQSIEHDQQSRALMCYDCRADTQAEDRRRNEDRYDA